MTELTTSLELTQREVEDLKELKQCKEEKTKDNLTIKKLQEDLQGSKVRVKELEDRADYIEDYSRRNNLQVIGIEEHTVTETWEQTAVKVSKLLEEKLQLPNIELERAHRVGRRDSQRHRSIVARFTRFGDREAVLRNARKLRGTRIYINEDLCPASQSIKRAQLPFLKQARSEGKVAYFRGTNLIIKGINILICPEAGLCGLRIRRYRLVRAVAVAQERVRWMWRGVEALLIIAVLRRPVVTGWCVLSC